MSTPDVSVVMSVFDGAAELDSSIESVLDQGGVNFELIVVDDGSTDRTRELLEGFARRDSRVRILNQDNVGLTQSLVRGCKAARGKYIARQDVADISLPGRLRLQKALLDTDENIAFVSCWAEVCGPGWESLYVVKGTGAAARPTCVIPRNRSKGRLLDEPTSHPTVLFRRDAYHRCGGYQPEFYFGQDRELWYRLAEVGLFAMVERPLYRVKLTLGSISSEFKSQQDRLGKLAHDAFWARQRGVSDQDQLREASKIRPLGARPRSQKANAAWLYFIGECLRKNRDPRALRYLVKSLKIDPLAPKTWVRLSQSVVLLMSGTR